MLDKCAILMMWIRLFVPEKLLKLKKTRIVGRIKLWKLSKI